MGYRFLSPSRGCRQLQGWRDRNTDWEYRTNSTILEKKRHYLSNRGGGICFNGVFAVNLSASSLCSQSFFVWNHTRSRARPFLTVFCMFQEIKLSRIRELRCGFLASGMTSLPVILTAIC